MDWLRILHQMFFGGLAAMGFGVLFNMYRHHLLWCGLAGGLALLFEGGTAAQALGQLSMRFGHFNRSPTGVLDAFFLHYQATAEGRVPFIDWVRDEYDEVAVRTRFRAHGLATFLNDAVLRRE